jgi:hypothetical protein
MVELARRHGPRQNSAVSYVLDKQFTQPQGRISTPC